MRPRMCSTSLPWVATTGPQTSSSPVIGGEYFDEFFTDIDGLAATLQHDVGVKPGDRIAIAMRNCPDWVVVFAAVHVGAAAVLIDS